MYKSFADILRISAEKNGKKTAFIIKKGTDKYENISYSKFYSDVVALSAEFKRKGFSRIAVIGKNCYEWLLTVFASIYTDIVAVPLDKGLSETEINIQLEKSQADVLVYSPEIEKYIKNIAKVKLICFNESDQYDCIGKYLENGYTLEQNYNYNSKSDCMNLLLFTSGTTSQFKAVMLSQKNIIANVEAMNEWEHFEDDDINLLLLPLHHTFGLTQAILFISCGLTQVFCEGLRIQKALNEYKVTLLVGVPLILETMKKMIIKTATKEKKLFALKTGIILSNILRFFGIDIRRKLFHKIISQLGNLRLIISGAAPLEAKTSKFFNDIGIILIQGYGLTETAPVLAAENPENMRKNSVGKALPGVDIKISTPNRDGYGEIIAKGDNIMLGYYQNETLTEEVIKDGYFYTGDLGYIDKDNYIFITGRCKNVIVLQNGKNVYPEEIEALIYSYDYVKECIIKNNDENGKDKITAIIFPDENVISFTDAKLNFEKDIVEINHKLADYKQISDFIISEKEFDKTTTGKIKRY